MPPVVLSSGKSTISFDHIALIDTVVRTDNNNNPQYDYGEIAYSNDFGDTWNMIKWVNVKSSPGFILNNLEDSDWQSLAFSLSDMVGDTVLFKFTLGSNDFRNNDGWYIDNILLDDRPSSVDYNKYDMTMISVNPNPIKNSARLAFKTLVNDNVTIELYDILGNRLLSQDLGMMQAGEYSYDYNFDEFASGMYIYKISIGNYIKTITVSVTK